MNQNVIASHDAHLIYVPFHLIDLSDERCRFRRADAAAVQDLRAGLMRSGQTHPALLEQRGPNAYAVLDGHRRADAIRSIRETGGHWEKMLAHVVPAGRLSLPDLFRLLRERNMAGENPFGLIERGRFFQYFFQQGLAVQDIGRYCGIGAHETEDVLELADTPPELAGLLNPARIEPAFALMLARRYRGWARGAFAHQALSVAQRLIAHARAEKPTMKGWRFLLDFYWPGDRPFLARSS